MGFINYRGHGNYNCWSSFNRFTKDNVCNLKIMNNSVAHVFSLACHTGDISRINCFGTAWIKNLKAISFLGASCATFSLVNNQFDKILWEEIARDQTATIGDIFFEASRKLYQTQADNNTKRSLLAYLLLGDPTTNYMDGKS